MTPGCTGEPWKAPAWYLSSAKPATNRPSFVAPIFTRTVAPERVPVDVERVVDEALGICISVDARTRIEVQLLYFRTLADYQQSRAALETALGVAP